jgi:hypothetical protein
MKEMLLGCAVILGTVVTAFLVTPWIYILIANYFKWVMQYV